MTNFSLIYEIQKEFLKKDIPEIKTWMEIEIDQFINEWNKTRIQKFKWLVIKTSWKTPLEKTIIVRRKIWNFWLEKIFAIHSDSISSIKVLRSFKVRRKYIKYIRKLTWKAARLKEIK